MLRILWDEPKRLSNLERRGLDFADLNVEFFEGAFVVPAKMNRLRATGWLGSKVLTVIFKPLGGEGLSVISMRIASQKERNGIDKA